MTSAGAGIDNQKKSIHAFKTISEVALELDVPQHVLRFWETKFSQIKPMKRAGGRRYYRPEDVELLSAIRQLLHTQGYTIRGVQKMIREKGVKSVFQPVTDDRKQDENIVAKASVVVSTTNKIPDITKSKLTGIRDDLLEIKADIVNSLN